MTDIAQFLQQAAIKPSAFSFSSRYKNIATATMAGPDGESIIYLKRRFVPKAENFSLLQEHIVKDGDRLDNITNQYIGDPERFWQVCDANNVLHPLELTGTPQKTIRITLPEGIPGYNNA